MRGFGALVLLAACSGGEHLSRVAKPVLGVAFSSEAAPQGGYHEVIQVSVGSGDAASCPSLPWLSGSVDGARMRLMDPGGMDTHWFDSSDCKVARLTAPLPPPQPGGLSEIVVSDGDAKLRLEVVDLFLARTVTVAPAGPVHPGDAVTLTWDDANDELPATTYDAYGQPAGPVDKCAYGSEPEIQLGYGRCVPSTLGTRTVSFTVPADEAPGTYPLLWEAAMNAQPRKYLCTAAGGCWIASIPYGPQLALTVAP